MELTNWAPEHSDALREHLANGLSFSKAVKVINSKFNTAYTRSAAIGRARRLGLAGPGRPVPSLPAKPPGIKIIREFRAEPSSATPLPWLSPPSARIKPAKLRCVEIEPRHLSLIELERRDCRYPYGGDVEGEAITFCGHPRRPGSSYCTPHFGLSRNFIQPLEFTADVDLLRLLALA